MKKAVVKKKEYVSITTPIGLISFPYLFAPDTGRDNSSNKYSIEIYVPKPVWAKEGKSCEEMVLKVGREYFKNPSLELSDFKNPFTDMDLAATALKPIEDYQKGTIRIRAKAAPEYPPTVIGPRKGENGKFPTLSPDEVKKIKGGDYGRLIAGVYGYSQSGGGVALGLNFVQFAYEGKALGQGKMKQIEALGEIEVGVDSPDSMIDTADAADQDFA